MNILDVMGVSNLSVNFHSEVNYSFKVISFVILWFGFRVTKRV